MVLEVMTSGGRLARGSLCLSLVERIMGHLLPAAGLVSRSSLPPSAPLRRPTRILRSSPSPLSKKDDVQKSSTDRPTKESSSNDVKIDAKNTDAGRSKPKEQHKDQPKTCDKCGQKIK